MMVMENIYSLSLALLNSVKVNQSCPTFAVAAKYALWNLYCIVEDISTTRKKMMMKIIIK